MRRKQPGVLPKKLYDHKYAFMKCVFPSHFLSDNVKSLKGDSMKEPYKNVHSDASPWAALSNQRAMPPCAQLARLQTQSLHAPPFQAGAAFNTLGALESPLGNIHGTHP